MSARERVKHPMATVHKLFEEVPESNGHGVRNWNRIKCWAAKNAYTLIFLSSGFIITWFVQILVGVFF